MTNRFDIPKAPLRAEPRPLATNVQSVPATPGSLIRSTLFAAGAAGVQSRHLVDRVKDESIWL